MDEKQICLNCGKENNSDANFCKYCGTKITEICLHCWRKNEGPYNCGFNKCPGYRLLLEEISKAK